MSKITSLLKSQSITRKFFAILTVFAFFTTSVQGVVFYLSNNNIEKISENAKKEAYQYAREEVEYSLEEVSVSIATYIKGIESEVNNSMLNAANLLKESDKHQNITNKYLEELVRKTSVDDLSLSNAQGVFTHSVIKDSIGFNIFSVNPEAPLVARGKKDFTVTPFKVSTETGEITKFLSVPRANLNGIAQVSLESDKIAKNLNELMDTKNGIEQIYLINPDNVILASAAIDENALKAGEQIKDQNIKSAFNSKSFYIQWMDDNIAKTYYPFETESGKYLLRITTQTNHYFENYNTTIDIVNTMQSDFQSTFTKFLAVSIVALIILLLSTSVYFRKEISQRIKLFSDKLEFLAQGDFTQPMEITSKDELGQMNEHYNNALDKLKNIIHKISQSSEIIASNAEELTASTEETNKSVNEVAASIQEVAANNSKQSEYVSHMNGNTEDIHDKMTTISDTVELMKSTSIEHAKLAHEGNKHVEEVIGKINEINEQVTQSSFTINELNEKSKKIEEILSMITNISEQTNLLALNAAIEAARAGEHGKGFAVVADEVRKLAEQSTQASNDINILIKDIQEGVTQSTYVMNKSMKTTQSGIQVVEETGKAFKEISLSIDDVTRFTDNVYKSVKDVLDATQKMKKVSSSVNEIASSNDSNAQNVSAVTQQQSAIIEEMTNAIGELASMATELQIGVKQFKI